MRRVFIFLTALAILFAGKHFLQEAYDDGYYARRREVELFYLPSVESSKIISFGFNNVYSNYLFIRSLTYFLDHFKGDKDYEYLEHQYNIIVELDPYFTKAYTFGSLALFIAHDSLEKPIRLLMKGWQIMPHNWRLIQEIAFFYYQYKMYDRAAEWYLKASEIDGLDENLKRRFIQLYYTCLELKGDFEMAKYSWLDLYLYSEDDITKELAAKRLFLIFEVENIKNIINALEIYRAINKSSPKSLEDLLQEEYSSFFLHNELYPAKGYIYSENIGNILIDYMLLSDFDEYGVPIDFNQIYPFYYFPETEEIYKSIYLYLEKKTDY